jgi:hypothetical protein
MEGDPVMTILALVGGIGDVVLFAVLAYVPLKAAIAGTSWTSDTPGEVAFDYGPVALSCLTSLIRALRAK